MTIEGGNINTFIEKVFHSFDENDHSRKSIDFLKKIHLNNNECLYLLDLYQNEIIYRRGFSNLLGYDDDKITFEFLFSNLHPDDSDIVHRVTKATILYSLDHPDNSINNQLFLTYRHRTRKGTYIKVLNQVTIFEVNKSGLIKTLLIRLSNISFLDDSDNVNWTFKADQLDEKAFKEIVYKSYQGFFSKRQEELIHEIVKGNTNRQIGNKLHISEYTVASHRKQIFKRSNCHNYEELTLFCKGIGLL